MRFALLAAALLLLHPFHAEAQDTAAVRRAIGALPVRSIGPAFMGGRIADVEVHPTNRATWYVAVGSGGVWKTVNGGATWTPLFDDQPRYSIGEITLDPGNPEVVWVGTGENVSGRHVSWGDGVYRSRDGGRTWQQMGLPNSQHIGRILVDPRDGNVVLVAAEGPLWSAGGDRGVYRSTDGGATWTRTLHVDEHTGVTDLEFDPSNPDVLYAAAYQRRRHAWGFLAAGPKSGIWKSADNGKTWRQVTTGLPKGDVGKIGLAVTPADPSLVYATIEASEEERGFYRSTDGGESWEKRNGYISGGTGPHYYQEIEASPTDPHRVYQMDVFLHVTRDGGATFAMLETGRTKHSDNHALWIDPDDGRHLLVGTDAGLYESFDEGATWRHFPNLPVSQFYKIALNNREPFYDVLGGTQDLGTLHGPTRTTNRDGIRNQDWYVPLGADGHGAAFDPRDPDLMYLEWQQGNLYRKHRRHDEELSIKPQPAADDPPERYNWDAPILVSPHNPDRLWFGTQRLWRSDDQGNTWTPVSGDLTQGQNRYELRFMGRVWGLDALYDHGAMSKWATLTAVSESPVQEGVLVTGSDDGLVHVSPDGGRTWTRAAALPGLPPTSYVNDVEASLHDARTIYVAADAHKIGDFSPYVYESIDLGRTWRSIAGDLPRGTIVWAVQQDHVRPDLLFAGTEFGLYVTPQRGRQLAQAEPRGADDQLPRPQDPSPRQRPGGGHLRPRDLRAGRLRAAPRDGGRRARNRGDPLPGPRRLVVRPLPARPGTGPARTGERRLYVAQSAPRGPPHLLPARGTDHRARGAPGQRKGPARARGRRALPRLRAAPRGGAGAGTPRGAAGERRRGPAGALDRGARESGAPPGELGPARPQPRSGGPAAGRVAGALERPAHRAHGGPRPVLRPAHAHLRQRGAPARRPAALRSEARARPQPRHRLRRGGRLPAGDGRPAPPGGGPRHGGVAGAGPAAPHAGRARAHPAGRPRALRSGGLAQRGRGGHRPPAQRRPGPGPARGARPAVGAGPRRAGGQRALGHHPDADRHPAAGRGDRADRVPGAGG